MPRRRRVNPLTQPVVGLDIDGTLGQYYKQFHWFAEMYVGRPLKMDFRDEYKGSFNKALGISRPLYREVKLAYRQSGLKRNMDPFSGVADLTRSIRDAGAQIWICTTRPYQRLDNVDPDTREWLKRFGVAHDHLLFGPNKYRDLCNIVGRERVAVILDDLPEQHVAAEKLGIHRILRDGAHNRWAQGGVDNRLAPYEWMVLDSEGAKQLILNILDHKNRGIDPITGRLWN